MRHLIPIINVDLAKHPEVAQLRSAVTVEHVLYPCPRCGEDGWIGPTQKRMAEAGGGDVLCYKCLFKDHQGESLPVIQVNPAIEDVPRRFGPA